MDIKINICNGNYFYGIYKLKSIDSEYRWVYHYISDAGVSRQDKNLFTLQTTIVNWEYKFSPEHLKGEGVAVPYEHSS